MERIRIAGLEVQIEPKGQGVYEVALILPVFGKKASPASALELKAMRDAIDRALAAGSAAPQPRPTGPVRR